MVARLLSLSVLVAASIARAAVPPGVHLAGSTFLGGSMTDEIFAAASDGAGAMYVAGRTDSPDLPAAGSLQPSLSPGLYQTDGFVAKLASDGTLTWITYLGGSLDDAVIGIAVDAAGDVYVAGQTSSCDFPTTPTGYAPDPSPNVPGGACPAGFLSRISGDGKSLLWSTWIRGDTAIGVTPHALALSGGLACVAGAVSSATLPTTPDAPQPVKRGAANAFVTCFDTSRSGPSSLAFSTYYGGTNYDEAYGIAADSAGRLIVAGTAHSVDFPTVNALQTNLADVRGDAFVFALSPARSVLYATYLGGGNQDSVLGVAATGDGGAVVTGQTKSSDFPIKNAAQPVIGGGPVWGETCGDAFVTRLDASGQLAFSTFLGGTTFDWGRSVAVDLDGTIHACGATDSVDFPVMSGAIDPRGMNQSAFAVGLLSDGRTVLYSTYYQTAYDVFGCATGSGLVMAGQAPSGSEVIGIPVRPRIGGMYDGYAARLSAGAVGTSDIELSATSTPGRSGALEVSLSVANHGPDPATSVVLRGAASPGGRFSVAGQGCVSVLGYFLLCDLGSVPVGATVGLPIVVSASVGGPLDVWFWTVANQSDPYGVNDVASSHAIIPLSHLVTTTAGTPADVAQGEEVLVTVTVFDDGPDAADGVEVILGLPAWWQPGAAGLPGQCGLVPGTSQVLCRLGTIQPGASAGVDLPIKLIAAGASSFYPTTTSMSLESKWVPEGTWTTNVRSADASLAAMPSSAVINAGQTATFQLSLEATAGVFQASFTLDCAGLPAGTTCRFTPASLSPGGGSASGAVAIETTGRTAMAGSTRDPGGSLLASAFLGILGGFGLSIRRAGPRTAARFAAIALVATTLAAACGQGAGSPPGTGTGGTPPGTYVVTVTATLQGPMGFGALARSTQLTVTVN